MDSQTQDNSEQVLQEASSQLGSPVTHFMIKHGSNGSIEQATDEAATIMSGFAKLKASGKNKLYGPDGSVLIEKVD